MFVCCYFQSLLSHKYGYISFPRCIEATEFETMMQKVESNDTLNLFKKYVHMCLLYLKWE